MARLAGWGGMVVILKSFEHAATKLSPIVLVLPGLTATALGLFLWLGGLGFRRLSLAVMGALTGAFCVLCAVGENPMAMALAGLVVALLAVVFQRFFAAVLLGALAGAGVFLMVAWPHLGLQQGTLAGQFSSGDVGQTLSVPASLDMIRMYALDMTDAARRAGGQLVASRWAIVAAVMFALLLVGLLFRQLGAVLVCSILGTAMIFAGLVLLLMFKGAGPIMRIEARAPFFGLVLLAMVIFGTLEQWGLCRRAEKRDKAGTEKRRSRKQDGKRSWRDR